MGEERNYARFYCLLKKLPWAEKEMFVRQYTSGRTTHLHETTQEEYSAMCEDLERMVGFDEVREHLRRELKRKRSACLKLMQQLGIDTTDWARVDNFCEHPRIAGKAFRHIEVNELGKLLTKLRTIQRKGGIKPQRSVPQESISTILLPISNTQES